MNSEIHAVTMPKWGMTMQEGTIVNWLVSEGDPITVGDEFLEIETTKITNVVEAHAGGVLRKQLIPASTTVPVGTLLAVIAGAAVEEPELEAFIASFKLPNAEIGELDEDAEKINLIETADHSINVVSMGKADEQIMLIHGFGGDVSSWMFTQQALAESFTVHAMDLPGHGRSSMNVGSGSVPELAMSVLGVMDALDIDCAHFSGHSLGGEVALFLAINHANRVRSASLLCSTGLGHEINLEFIDGFIRADRRKEMRAVLGSLFAGAIVVNRQMLENTLKYKRLDGVENALSKIRYANFTGTGQAGGMRSALDILKVPVQVIWGKEDQIIPVSHTLGLPDIIQIHLLAETGHMPQMEKPGQVTQMIVDFVRKYGE